MKYYYLLNGKIMSANEKMPIINEQWHNYNSSLLKWSESLQQCEISESELNKIKGYLWGKTSENPIEVTDIVWEKLIDYAVEDDTNSSFKTDIFFKQPKQVEEIEAVEFLDFVLSSGWHLNPHSKENRWRTIEQINSTKPMLSDGITTKQLYEMFKNQK